MTRLAVAFAALVATTAALAAAAIVIASCGGEQLWSFDYPDASASLTAAAEALEASAAEASVGQVQDARAPKDGNALLESGPPGSGCPSPAFDDCVPCSDASDCQSLQCGTESRCVQCTNDEGCSKGEICFDEHCVSACSHTSDCFGKTKCSLDVGFDAGFCFECGPYVSPGSVLCPQEPCNSDGICVECAPSLAGGCGMSGTCSEYGYCVGLPSRDAG